MTSFATTTSQYLTPEYLRVLPEQYGSPVWVYDSAVIIERIKQLQVF
ncbi:diaminopimelate decarboxylase [Providencia rettgeri]|nr:diaminopimelate decarboxylase [Providencia rettgeri]